MGGGDDGAQLGGRGDAGHHGGDFRQAHGVGERRLHRVDAGFGQPPADARQGRGVAVHFGRQGLGADEQQAIGEDGGGVDRDVEGGEFGQQAGVLGALVQQVAAQLDHVGLEAASQQGRAVLDRGAEADAAVQAAVLEGQQPVPQGAALGAGEVVGAGDQQQVAARQAEPFQRAAGAGLDPVDAVADGHGADRDLEGRGEGPGLAEPAFAVAVRFGGDAGDAGIGGGLEQKTQGFLARAGRRRYGAFGLMHDGQSQFVDRGRGAAGDHRRTVTAKV